jgi:hypothetical protein
VRNHLWASVVAVAAVAFSPVNFAQTAQHSGWAKTQAGSATPDFSGVWFVREYHKNILPKEDPPFQPWAEALYQKRDLQASHADPDSGPDPTARCIPPGIPRTMLQPFPWEIVQARDRVVMIFEYQSLVRQIFTDGRGHPKDLEPTYMGHSIGRYEGDTLVVDTIGFNDKTWLDRDGHGHSDELHVTERFHRTDRDNMQIDITMDDPKALAKPWVSQISMQLKPEWDVLEQVCTDNAGFLGFEK